jgi:hypothetical protein
MTSTFEESCARFRKFLGGNGYPVDLIWIAPPDLLAGDRLFYVRLPVPDINVQRVRECFENAMEQQSGIVFTTVCELGSATCCRVWVPADEDERERAMCPRDLKLCAQSGNSRIRGQGVRSRFKWEYLRFRHRDQQALISDFFRDF